jgi:DNA-binding SARP family transcriptional activator/tetratricopeptide (TPR) repeat protein
MGADEPRFFLFGPLVVEVGGEPVSPPGSAVVRGLLGVLLLAGGRPLSAAQLIDLVWADRAERVGRGPVQTAISRLRDWLSRLPGRTPAIEYDHGGYRLLVPPESVDLGRFRALLEQAAEEKDAARRCPILRSAMELRRGPLLSDLPDLDRSGSPLRELEDGVRRAAVLFGEAAVAAGQAGSAIPHVTAMAEEYPLDEELQASLIELLAVDGRPADALRHYQRVRDRIADEIGVEPGARVRRAYLTVLARDRDHGPAPLVEAAIPPPAQLPPDTADFTGRDAEVVELTAALGEPGTSAIAAISGMGGVGKTVLALHVAHLLAARFPDGQLYAQLGSGSSPRDPGQVLGGFLTALGIAGHAVPGPLEERTALFRSLLAGRRVLVVLDNAAGEQQVRPLLPGSPGSAVIVTSRTRLAGLGAVTAVELEVFGAHEATGLLARIAGAERVMAEPAAAAEIARLCAHVPLAVRIAGARLAYRRHWSLDHLATILGDEHRRLDELAAGDLAVRAGFEVAYVRLPPTARTLFRLLGLLDIADFAGWVAAAVLDAAPDEAQTHLEVLIDAQLLGVAGIDPTGRPRYRLHDLVRLYARERALQEDAEEARAAALERAFGAWLSLAERAAVNMPGPCYAAIHGDAPRWPEEPPESADAPAHGLSRLIADPVSWFDAEWTALNAVARQARALGLDEFAWDLAGCLEKHFDMRGLATEWRETHERALELCRSTGNLRGEAVLLRGLIEVTTWISPDPSGPAMIALHERSRRLLGMFEELGDPRGMTDALVNCGWGLVAEGNADEALEAAQRALALAQESDHLGGQARAHHLMGVARADREESEAAVDHLTRALELARELGNPRFEATAMQFLGAAHCMTGRIDSGHDLLVESLVMCHERGDRYAEAFSLLYLAKLYVGLDDPRARPTAEAVLSVSRRHDMGHHLADALKVLGDLDIAAGRYAAATIRLEESVQVWRSRGWTSFLAGTLRSLGIARAGTGDGTAAIAAWTEAQKLFERLGNPAAVQEITEFRESTCPAEPGAPRP